MKILLAAASVSTEMSGVQRHAFNVVRCLLGHPGVTSVTLSLAPWQRELARNSGLQSGPRFSFHFASMRDNSLSRILWFYRHLPALARQQEADLVHVAFPVPLDVRSLPCPVVVSLHDLYPHEIPSNFGLAKGYFNRLLLRQSLCAANAIACVSETTLLHLGRYVPREVRQGARRIYNCVEPGPACTLQTPLPGWSGEPFLLCVAQHRRNKNIPLLIRVFQRLRHTEGFAPSTRLLVVGIPGPETRSILHAIRESGFEDSILLRQGLSESELQWCYRNCEALVAPSTIEGFGLPVVEAMLAGSRVVCSDIPAHREFGGDSCHYVSLDGDAEAAFASTIVKALHEPRPLPLPMPELAAPIIADQYVSLYRRLLTPAIADLNLANQDIVLSSLHPTASIERHSS
jgi:glycosyltransferase involved in cell wall biosynthesis